MSIFFISKSGNDVYLNLSREDRTAEGTSHISVSGRAAFASIRSASAMKAVSADHLVAADTIYDEDLCLSPYAIFELPIHRDICAHVNSISDFGWSVREALEQVGAFDFISKVKNRQTYDATMERILAVFSMSTTGLTTIEDSPPDFIHAVVDFFRTPDGADWNRDLLGASDVTVQCASNVIRGLASIFSDESLLEKARKHRRSSAGQNPGFNAFTYSTDPLDRELLEYFKLFMEGSRMRPQVMESAVQNVSAWLKAKTSGKSVRELVFDANRPCSFSDYMIEKNGGEVSRTAFMVVDAARKFSISILEELAQSSGGRAMFDLVTAKEHSRFKNKLKKLPKPDSTRSRPLAERLIPLLREILEEGSSGWPGESGHFHEVVVKDGLERRIYCPVIPSLFLVMLELPLRMGQIRRLDTGEGDLFHFNADRMEWEKNTGPLAGYWEKKVGEGISTTDTRGYAREILDEIRPIVGINVSTNKTGKPYVMPWFLPNVQKILWNLRLWQEKNNPITAPLNPMQYVDASGRSPKDTLAEMPDIFPISRVFKNKYHNFDGRVVTYTEMHRAWGYILQEVERRWNERHLRNQVKLVDIHPKNKQPYRYRYTIHGLRVRGLTNLRRGGMPLDLLSKFVAGHASLRMTIYYTEPSPIEIADAIERAVANSESQRQFIDDLRVADIDSALEMTVSLSSTAVPEAYATESQFQFCNVSLGVCPFDASRCHDGGKLIRKEEKDGLTKDVHEPVQNRNCLVCRHFLTGPPFLMELVAYGTKLCERRQFLARERDRISALIEAYETACKYGKITKAIFENKYDSLHADILQICDEIEVNENSIFNIERLCNASLALMDNAPGGERGVLLIANSRSTINYEEISEFKQSVWITAHGRIHTILGDERVERKRDKYLDLIAANSDVLPPSLMTKISEQHRRMAMDQYAAFIDARVPDADVARLLDGTLRLQDLGIRDQVLKLIDIALSSAAPLPGAVSQQLLVDQVSP